MSVGLDVKINCNAAFQWLDERGAGLPAASETLSSAPVLLKEIFNWIIWGCLLKFLKLSFE